MDSSVSPKDEIWFLRVCNHISKQSTSSLSVCFHTVRRYNLTLTLIFFAFFLPYVLFSPFPLVLPLVLSSYSSHLVDLHGSFCLSAMSNLLSSFPTIQHAIRVVTSQASVLALSSFRSMLTLCPTYMPCCKVIEEADEHNKMLIIAVYYVLCTAPLRDCNSVE
jgi:hypothetical protein